MSDKLKPCPFCKASGYVENGIAMCSSPDCAAIVPTEENINQMSSVDQWNNRPIEDRLRRQRDELLEMLTRPKRLGLTDKDAWAEELDNLVQRIEKEVNDGDTL